MIFEAASPKRERAEIIKNTSHKNKTTRTTSADAQHSASLRVMEKKNVNFIFFPSQPSVSSPSATTRRSPSSSFLPLSWVCFSIHESYEIYKVSEIDKNIEMNDANGLDSNNGLDAANSVAPSPPPSPSPPSTKIKRE
jgi:hypothetical protein